MDPPVRSGTGDSAAFFGNDNALSRRPKVPCDTQRRHLRLILSPKGAARYSKAALTAYSVVQRCRAVLKGGTYGLFCRPKVPCGTQRRHLRLILSPKGAARYSKAALTAYSVAQRCRATLKGGTYGLFCRPKAPCDTQRRHLRGLFVAREHSDKLSREQNTPFRSRDILGRPFREQNAAFRSRDILGRLFREQNAPSRSRDASEDPFVSRTHRLAHETTLADSFVSRTHYFAHETSLADPSVSRTRCLTHETTSDSELSCATGTLRGLYGNSTGTLRGLYGRSSMPPR